LQTDVSNNDGDISAISTDLSQLSTTVDGNTSTIQTQATSIDGLEAQYTVKIDNNGAVAGFGLASTTNSDTSGGQFSEFYVNADRFAILPQGGVIGTDDVAPFIVQNNQVFIDDAVIANGSIDNAKIANAAIDSAKIQNGEITTAKIANAAVDNAKIDNAAISEAKIQNAAISTAKIQDLSVETLKVKDRAITEQTSNSFSHSFQQGTQSESVTFSTQSQSEVIIIAAFSTFSDSDNNAPENLFDVEVKVNGSTVDVIEDIRHGNFDTNRFSSVKSLTLPAGNNTAELAIGLVTGGDFEELHRGTIAVLEAKK